MVFLLHFSPTSQIVQRFVAGMKTILNNGLHCWTNRIWLAEAITNLVILDADSAQVIGFFYFDDQI